MFFTFMVMAFNLCIVLFLLLAWLFKYKNISPFNYFMLRMQKRKLLSKLPGPRGLPFIGLSFSIDRRRPYTVFETWASLYGSVYSFEIFGTTIVVLSSIEVLFFPHPPSFFSRSSSSSTLSSSFFTLYPLFHAIFFFSTISFAQLPISRLFPSTPSLFLFSFFLCQFIFFCQRIFQILNSFLFRLIYFKPRLKFYHLLFLFL